MKAAKDRNPVKCNEKWVNWSYRYLKRKGSIEVSESETFESYDEKLKNKYGDNWLGKGRCTGLEFKRWLALRDDKTEIP